jgi:hypothetical protein
MKEKDIFKMDYYQTYYFADICNAIMEDEFRHLRSLDDFWGNGQINSFIKPFQKYSNLHMFIEFTIDRLFYESNQNYSEFTIDELLNKKFWINNTLDYHNIKHISFKEWYQNNNSSMHSEDLMYKYLEFLEFSDFYIKLKEQMVEEAFFILFLNRKFLREFNLNISGILEISDVDDINDDELIKQRSLKLKRKHIPKWAEKAVFFRDRGICTYCKKDLSGVINISNKYHIDHIVPLAKYGLNDVSNLQLLCEFCNTSKGSKHTNISNDYERWY